MSRHSESISKQAIAALAVVMLVLALACQGEAPTPTSPPVTATSPAPTATYTQTPRPTEAPSPTTTEIHAPTSTPATARQSMMSTHDLVNQAVQNLANSRSVSFEIDATLEAQTDDGTHRIPIKYTGETFFRSFDRMDVAVTTGNETDHRRVLTVGSLLDRTLLFDPSTGNWEVDGRESPFSIDFEGLFGLEPSNISVFSLREGAADSQTVRQPVKVALRFIEIAGAVVNLDAVYSIGIDDGHLWEIQASGKMMLRPETTLLGDINAESASISLTAKLFDHGKQTDMDLPVSAVPRYSHQAWLLSDGRILLAGGLGDGDRRDGVFEFSWGMPAELYNPSTNTWTFPDFAQPPLLIGSALGMGNDEFLFAGLGLEGNFAFLFRPVTDEWTAASGREFNLAFPNMLLLEDGRALLVSGEDILGELGAGFERINAVEIFDPASGAWMQAESMHEPPPFVSMTHSWSYAGRQQTSFGLRVSEIEWIFSSAGGRAIVLGVAGGQPFGIKAYGEAYDPSSNKWTIMEEIEPYYIPTAAVELSDGRLLVIGNHTWRDDLDYLAPGFPDIVELPDGRTFDVDEYLDHLHGARIYDPLTDAWTIGEPMNHVRAAATLTLLPDGRVLAAGGYDPGGSFNQQVEHTTTEIFDPATGEWSPGPDLAEPRWRDSATLLPDGRIILLGGLRFLSESGPPDVHLTAEVIDPR